MSDLGQPAERLTVAADVGKTGCRVQVTGAHGSSLGHGDGALGLAAPDGPDEVFRAVVASAKAAGVTATPLDAVTVVSVATAGYLAATDRGGELADRFAVIWPEARLVLTSDIVASHLAAFDQQPGILVAAGTGTTAFAIGSTGRYAIGDGAGFLLGDDGSGYAIGRAGLRVALGLGTDPAGGLGFSRGTAARDSMPLREAAERHFGDLAAIPRKVQSATNPARVIAGFAEVVADVAAAGDPVANQIWVDAGYALAATALSASLRVLGVGDGSVRGGGVGGDDGVGGIGGEPLPVCLTGGLAQAGSLLRDPFGDAVAALWPKAGLAVPSVVEPKSDAVYGAQALAKSVPKHLAALVSQYPPARGAENSGPAPETAMSANAASERATERADPKLADLDLRSTVEVIEALWQNEAEVVPTLLQIAPQLAAVVDAIAPRFAAGGRLIYVGAGTPGRLAFVDASEIPPTFGTDPAQVVALMAGGSEAFRDAVEGAEDDSAAGAADLAALDIIRDDSVVGVAASGSTPYVVAALQRARELGALTVAVANNPDSPLAAAAHYRLELLTGPEVVTGSTRLKAGTAQKLLLNALSTTLMVRLGKTYGSLMVDMLASNAKLRRRAVRMVALATDVEAAVAEQALIETHWQTQAAIVMLLRDLPADKAVELIRRHRSVRAALAAAPT